MKREEIFNQVQRQYDADKKDHPTWPVHVCGQAAMVGTEAGRLLLLSTEEKYRPFKDENYVALQEEAAVKTIVACIRFMENLKK